MEITVTIAGTPTRFKKTGGTMRRYKSRFGREWFADLYRIARMQRKAAETAKADGLDLTKASKKKSDKMTDDEVFALASAVAQYDSVPFYDMLYMMAKEADISIPDTVEDWLDTFDDFPYLQVWGEVSPMLSREMAVDKKNA